MFQVRSASERQRLLAWIGCAGLALLTALAYAHSFERFDDWTPTRVLAYLGLGVAMLGLVFAKPHTNSLRSEAIATLLLATLLRVALLPTPESDDLHRYLWEGKLVSQGVNPYEHRGDSPELADYRDAQWEAMNNKDKWTAYPPAAMLLFSGLSAVAYSPFAFKLAFTLIDLLVVSALLATARRRRLPLRFVGLYAYNPAVLIAFAGEGHFDVAMLLCLALCGLLADRKQWIWAGIALALATQLKIIALLGLPFLLLHGRTKSLLAFATTSAALCLPFARDLPQLAKGLFLFGAERDFNGLPNLLGNLLGLNREQLLLPIALIFAIAYLAAWRRPDFRNDWHQHLGYTLLLLLLLAPTVHFWYWTWIALLLPLTRNGLACALCITQGLYFLVWQHFAATGVWDISDPQSALAWAPALIGLPILLLAKARDFRSALSPRIRPSLPPRSWDDALLVVIPTFNAAQSLPACLSCLLPQLQAKDQVIVCDANSQDDTLALARLHGIDTLTAPKGRGPQILAGLEAKDSRLALLLHADTQLAPGSLNAMREALLQNPNHNGGCLGQRFAKPGLFPYLTVEFLNESRAALGNVSFGDQCQFFDRAAFPNGRFPALPLMEDVELSLRLSQAAPTLYVGAESLSDAQKWQAAPQRRFVFVLQIFFNYLVSRCFRQRALAALVQKLYHRYYK